METAVISSQQFVSVLEAVTAQINVQSIVAVLGVAAGAAVGFVFMWWGVRKLISVVMKAVTKGRMNVG